MAEAGARGKKHKKEKLSSKEKAGGGTQHGHKLAPKKADFKKTKQQGKDTKNTTHFPLHITSALLAGEDGAPDFPRGVANLSIKDADAEEKFQNAIERKVKKPKNYAVDRRKGSAKGHLRTEDEWASLFGDGISGKLPQYANRITMKNVTSNMKLLGVISEVNSKDIVISLPGGLRGFVRMEEASCIPADDKHKDLRYIFHVGQLCPCVVTKVDEDTEGKGSKRIMLSVNLCLLHKGLTLDSIQNGMMLNAEVTSVEDHGYILHFGLTSFSGFLPKTAQEGNEVILKTGQIVQGVVAQVDRNRGVVYLCHNMDLVSKSIVKDLKGISIESLVPGMMVDARVHATLENGIMLSFLTYFTGTVDIFHLKTSFPGSTWKDDYFRGRKLTARILFIDPITRAIGLTLNPHLICNRAPPCNVRNGDIFETSKIIRVDRGIGLLLEVPSVPDVSPVYIHKFDAADDKIKKFEKRFKEGSLVRVRIVGIRHLEGLAAGTLKASAFEGSIFTHEDVKPGMVAKAKVIAVESFGAFVQFPSGVKALCPLSHMSELEIVKPSKKFKVGAELFFRVLGCKSRRVTVTHKKTLVRSKLEILASYADAVEGLITHGWITKIEKHGCFVKFYNGVHGFASRFELGLEPGSEPGDNYHIGQAVKCRIVSSVPASRRISVSFVLSPKADRDGKIGLIKAGSLVSGIVARLTSNAVIIELSAPSLEKGLIFDQHLADFPGHISLLKSLLKPGFRFPKLLVLDVSGNGLILSAKYSLLSSCQELTADVGQLHSHTVIHGYICNIIDSGCFVRFLGPLTGYCPLSKTCDSPVGNIFDAFYVGQSVRTKICNICEETGKITLSLKQSSCFSTNASFIESYFLSENQIGELQASSTVGSCSWVKNFNIGQVVTGVVQEIKEFGVVINFEDQLDVIGFIASSQMDGRDLVPGSLLKAFVLDICIKDCLVDLSLKPSLLDTASKFSKASSSIKKKRKKDDSMELELNQSVNAIVEMVKENYLVLSLPDCKNAIAFASVVDYNTQKLPHKSFAVGQSVVATVQALPNSNASGRLLLLLQTSMQGVDLSSKRANKKSTCRIGSLVEAEITDITPIEIFAKFHGCRGRIHITEVMDDPSELNPLAKFEVGQLLTARIVAECGKGHKWELSIRPSLLTDTVTFDSSSADKIDYCIGQTVSGYVVQVKNDWVSLTISRSVVAQLFILDSSCEPHELEDFQDRFTVGTFVSGMVISINKKQRILRLMSHRSNAILKELPTDSNADTKICEHIHENDIVGGRIKKIHSGIGGLLVQIGPHLFGKAHYTELVDDWVPDPLSGYKEGQYVKCRVLEITRSDEGFIHADLSLRGFSEGSERTAAARLQNDTDTTKRFENVTELVPGMKLFGCVKTVSKKGCFVMLSRKLDARIIISNLSDGYIQQPEVDFPVGKVVHGRVLSVEIGSGRVDLTLRTQDGEKTRSNSGFLSLHDLQVGSVISGKVRRVEPYGVFAAIGHSTFVGLCHISQIPGDFDDLQAKYKIGDEVKAKVLNIDLEKKRISLGMKDLFDADNDVPALKGVTDISDNGHIAQDDLAAIQPDLVALEELGDNIYEKLDGSSRLSVPPLDVQLDDITDSDVKDDINLTVDLDLSQTGEKPKRLKKKEKELRELEITSLEERHLKNDVPRSADEFEKLVRSSPNSSYLWIQYMAFMLSLSDIQKARSIAERALRTINIREENEKLNVWVAYLNLENEYGTPKEESVRNLFERALQYCDPKKIHLALLSLYDRTKQHTLANELLEKMSKKFRHSCKVWLLYVQNCLDQGKDDESQSIVKRALLSLPQRKHIKFVSHAAILEFKFGDPVRGRTLFEKMLRDYPKRTDLWSIYIDQEIRLGDVEASRALFEKATCLSLPPKKIKFLLKKYLEFEKAQNDDEKIEYVKRKALEYVESTKA